MSDKTPLEVHCDRQINTHTFLKLLKRRRKLLLEKKTTDLVLGLPYVQHRKHELFALTHICYYIPSADFDILFQSTRFFSRGQILNDALQLLRSQSHLISMSNERRERRLGCRKKRKKFESDSNTYNLSIAFATLSNPIFTLARIIPPLFALFGSITLTTPALFSETKPSFPILESELFSLLSA
jgi:hypothetical protein